MGDHMAAGACCNDKAFKVAQPFIPIFLQQTYTMLCDPELQNIISWESDTSIIIRDELEFIRVALPKYFSHSNLNRYASLIQNRTDFWHVAPVSFDSWTFMDFGRVQAFW